MKIIDILNKYKEADMFSLTGGIYKKNITIEDFQNALKKMTEKTKKNLKQIYDKKHLLFLIFQVLMNYMKKLKRNAVNLMKRGKS